MELEPGAILPVFAGMILGVRYGRLYVGHSPRIRGDDPAMESDYVANVAFSPYSRG